MLGPGNTYGLVNDTKKFNTFAEFKTVSNSENYQRVPAACASKEEVSVNMKAIAQVCNCTADQISSFLSRLRELAFNTAFTKKKSISLNFSIGHLWIQPSQTIEFKSIGYFDSASQMAAPIPSSIGDVRSQYLDDKSRASRENSIFNTGNSQKNKIASLLRRDEGEANNYSHLSDFLKSHIYRSKDKMMNKQHQSSRDSEDAFSQVSKKNKYNNQLIEKSSIEIRDRKMRDHGNKRAHSHASGSMTNSSSHIEKLQSAFLLGGRDRGGGDETSTNVKSYRGEMDPTALSDKKGSIGGSRATHSYLSNRLSRQRGGGRSIVNGIPEAQGGDAGSIVSIKSGNRKLNSQGNKRDIMSQRKTSQQD